MLIGRAVKLKCVFGGGNSCRTLLSSAITRVPPSVVLGHGRSAVFQAPPGGVSLEEEALFAMSDHIAPTADLTGLIVFPQSALLTASRACSVGGSIVAGNVECGSTIGARDERPHNPPRRLPL